MQALEFGERLDITLFWVLIEYLEAPRVMALERMPVLRSDLVGLSAGPSMAVALAQR